MTHVHYDIEAIEKDLRQQIEQKVAAVNVTAMTDAARIELDAQRQLSETLIIIARVAAQLMNAGISPARVDEILARYCGFLVRGLSETATCPNSFRSTCVQAANGDIQPSSHATVSFKSVQVGRA